MNKKCRGYLGAEWDNPTQMWMAYGLAIIAGMVVACLILNFL
jgi:hypothetical protein